MRALAVADAPSPTPGRPPAGRAASSSRDSRSRSRLGEPLDRLHALLGRARSAREDWVNALDRRHVERFAPAKVVQPGRRNRRDLVRRGRSTRHAMPLACHRARRHLVGLALRSLGVGFRRVLDRLRREAPNRAGHRDAPVSSPTQPTPNLREARRANHLAVLTGVTAAPLLTIPSSTSSDPPTRASHPRRGEPLGRIRQRARRVLTSSIQAARRRFLA